MKADLMYLLKILNGFVDKLKTIFCSSNFSVCDMQLCGNVLKLFVPKPRTDMLKFSLFIALLNIGTPYQLWLVILSHYQYLKVDLRTICYIQMINLLLCVS